MAAVIAFANQKGGVGKTTSAIHIAAALTSLSCRILLCDLDPQGNVASGLGLRKADIGASIYDVFLATASVSDAILPSHVPHLDLLPSHLNLVGLECELSGIRGGNTRFREILKPVLADYEYIIVDCPPSLSLLTVNALAAADGVVVPMTCDFYALEGLSQLHISMKRVRELYNPKLELLAILPTMYAPRLTLTKEVMAELQKQYGEKILKSRILRSVRLAEAPGFGKTVFETDPKGKSAAAYLSAAKELRLRI